jgi:hypothetical protein
MEAFHRALLAGTPPAGALRVARATSLRTGQADDRVAALAFNAYGDVLVPV